ncbi:MAG: ABC transporter permease [Flavobacteriales bacterium]|nr:ABC transporter permease [Flavobacteriales bacterium]
MPTNRPVRLIRPSQPFGEWLKQLFERRETLWFFVWKDLKVQYSYPILGIVWSVFQPLIYFGIILSVIRFSGRSGVDLALPFAVYLICGLTIWNFTTSAILGAMNSIQSNAGIISKSFFPRIYLILAPLLKSCIDLLIMLLITIGMAFFYDSTLSPIAIFLIPFAMITALLTALGWAALAASATVINRQVRHAIPVLLYAMIFALPVFYSMENIHNKWLQLLYQLNPIAGSMECFRAAFSGVIPSTENLIFWMTGSLIWATLGIGAFRKIEKTLADRV